MFELKAQSALNGRALHRAGSLHMAECPLRVLGLALVRGQSIGPFETRLDTALPMLPNTTAGFGNGWIVCTQPNMWRVYAGPERHSALVQKFTDLPAAAGLASDLGSQICTLELAGRSARRVIASGCPLNLNDRDFGTGSAAGSHLIGIAIYIVKTSDAPSFLLSCDRSHAPTVWDWLVQAAGSAGAPALDTEEAT